MDSAIISFALWRLNEVNKGCRLFETFCEHLVRKTLDPYFLPSSGTDAGGDGGIDGWSYLKSSKKAKYAFSIDKKAFGKIQKEIDKCDWDRYQKLCFFTNQFIKQRDKEHIYRNYQERDIAIYDGENLALLIQENEELGQHIDLPRILYSVTIAYLKNRNQLRSKHPEISEYIPRELVFWEDGSKNSISKPLGDFILECPKFTVIQAAAGYGKTCLMEQVHQAILNGIIDCSLPPVFVSLRDYTPGSLTLMIDSGLSAGGDFQSHDYLLLLDGIDEVPETDRQILVKEIGQNVNHSAYARKVVATAREHAVPLSEFRSFENLQRANLAPITRDDIIKLLRKNGIEQDDAFFSNTFFISFSDNIFYVTKFIEYYKKCGTIADDITNLFSFIVKNEMERLFRHAAPDKSALETLALYMTVCHTLSITSEQKSIIDKLQLEINSFPFHFSHKSIQEFLAAQKISRQSIDTIERILSNEGLILPHLINTFGFVLNILNLGDHDTFKELLRWSLQKQGNAKYLLQIEADRISDEMNHDIFVAVLEQESKIGSGFDMPQALVPFMLQRTESGKKNIKHLVNSITSPRNEDEFHYQCLVLMDVTHSHRSYVGEEEKQQLWKFFLELLDSERLNLAGYLFYSLCEFTTASNLSENQVDFLIEKALTFKEKSLFNNLCTFLNNREHPVDLDLYFRLLDFIVKVRSRESGRIARFVPSQISDDHYHEPIRIVSWDAFIELSRRFLEKTPKTVWDLFERLAYNGDASQPSMLRDIYDEFEELFAVFFNVLSMEIESHGLTVSKKNLLTRWLLENLRNHHSEPLWKWLSRTLENGVREDIVKDAIVQTECNYLQCVNLVDCHIAEVETREQFDDFVATYRDSDNEHLNTYFDCFCRRLPNENPIYEYVLEHLPEDFRTRLRTRDKETNVQQKQKTEKEAALRSSYKLAFDRDGLIEKIQAVFDQFGGKRINEDELFRCDDFKQYGTMNAFVRFVLREFISQINHTVSKREVIRYIQSDDWHTYYMSFLVFYCKRYSIKVDDFSGEEKARVVNWVKCILDQHPLSNADAPLKNIHNILCYIVRNASFLRDVQVLNESYRQKLIGLVFSGFHVNIESGGSVNYDAYSLDYLEEYLERKQLMEFSTSHFARAFLNDRTMLAVCGYLNQRTNDLLPYQKNKIKDLLIDQLNQRMNRSIYYEVIDLTFNIRAKVSDFDKALLVTALVLNKHQDGLQHNAALSLIDYGIKEKKEEDYPMICELLESAFDRAENDFLKKTLAERFLCLSKFAGRIFDYYADYLLADDAHAIGRSFARWGGGDNLLATADKTHLMKVQDLYLYSRAKKKPSERRDTIHNMALTSYKLIADQSTGHKDLEDVLASMYYIHEQGHPSIMRHIYEIENRFSKRSYCPITLEELIQLA